MARPGAVDKGLFQRPAGSGIWWIRWRGSDGLYKRKKVGDKRKAIAEYTLQCGRVAMEKQRPDMVPPKPVMTVADLVNRYAEMTRVNLRNWVHYERYGRYWTEFIGEMPIEDVLPSHIEAYKAMRLGGPARRHTGKRSKPVGPATVNKEVKRLGRLYELARKDRLTTSNPVREVDLLVEPPGLERYLLKEEVPRLGRAFPPHEWPIAEIAYRTGMRRMELFGLERVQVNFESLLIRLPRTKNSKARNLPITPKLERLLREWILAQVPSRWVFPSENPETHIDPTNWADRVLKPACQRAAIYDVTLHTFRHTYASWLVMAGAPLPEVMYLMGHLNIQTTMRYAHLAPGGSRHIQALLDDE